jgi:hypothetical protein
VEGYKTGTICGWDERDKICVQMFGQKYIGKIYQKFLWRKYFIKNIFKNYGWGFGTVLN